MLVVIGPNGSGKSTLLLSLALLLKPTTGTILYQGQTLSNGKTLQLRRQFAVVFQDPLLLNTTVWDNVTLGLRLRGIKKEEIRSRTQKWLERFGIASLATRRARTLSGGEAKRVSLARALVLQPDVLFLDEPFAALDSPTRQSLMEDFAGILRETGVSTIMVTHDRNEAIVLASRVAVLISGRLRQIGDPDEVFSCPVDEEVASFIQAGNIIHGVVSLQSSGLASVNVSGQQLDAVADLAPGTKVTMFVRYEDITLSLPPMQTTSARNHFIGKILKVLPVGSQMRVTVDCGFPLVALITKRSWEELGLELGQRVIASFKASSLHPVPRHQAEQTAEVAVRSSSLCRQ